MKAKSELVPPVSQRWLKRKGRPGREANRSFGVMTRKLWLTTNDFQGQICFNGIRENTDLSCHLIK